MEQQKPQLNIKAFVAFIVLSIFIVANITVLNTFRKPAPPVFTKPDVEKTEAYSSPEELKKLSERHKEFFDVKLQMEPAGSKK